MGATGVWWAYGKASQSAILIFAKSSKLPANVLPLGHSATFPWGKVPFFSFELLANYVLPRKPSFTCFQRTCLCLLIKNGLISSTTLSIVRNAASQDRFTLKKFHKLETRCDTSAGYFCILLFFIPYL